MESASGRKFAFVIQSEMILWIETEGQKRKLELHGERRFGLKLRNQNCMPESHTESFKIIV